MTPDQHELLIRIDERVGDLVKEGKDVEVRVRGLERFLWIAGCTFASLMSAFGIKSHLM